MREIKFRALVNGEWLYFDLTQNPKYWAHKLEGGIIDQYTGLKDKNGVEIYERDITKQDYERDYNFEYDPHSLGYMGHETDYGWHKGVVSITASNGACLRNPIHYSESKEKTEVTKMYKKITGYRSEVIGNIYENPELLEEKTHD